MWKFVLLQGLPYAGKYIGFMIGVEPQNTAICPDRHSE